MTHDLPEGLRGIRERHARDELETAWHGVTEAEIHQDRATLLSYIASEPQRIAEAVKKEREACAATASIVRLDDDEEASRDFVSGLAFGAERAAQAIRTRGE